MTIRWVILSVVMAMLVGCAGQNPVGEGTTKVENVRKSGFLEDYSLLRKGGEEEATLVYWNSKAKFASYNRVIVDPVTVWLGAGSNLKTVSLAERQKLANEFHSAIITQLKKDYEIVNTPGPGTMRIRVALTDARASNPTMDTISTYVPQARLIQSVATVGSETAGFVGEASAEAEVRDTQTGVLLAAGVDRRAGTKSFGDSTFDSWGDVREAFKKWAAQFSKNLANRRGN